MTQDEIIRMARENDEVPCKDHPDAPHGFNRNMSHTYDRYVCDCEFWEPGEPKIYTEAELEAAVLAEREQCAKVCEERATYHGCGTDLEYESENCAAAIRARGEK